MNNVLENDTIYMGGNGERFCGSHAGARAKTTGRDIDGNQVVKFDQPMAAEFQAMGLGRPSCERCGKEA